jgi:hypothetical protein
MQRRTPLAAIVAAARGLAVNGHQVRRIRPHRRRPGLETLGKQRRVDAVHQDAQPAHAGHTVMIGQETAQKRQIVRAPVGNVLEVVARRDRAADRQKQNLRQRMGHPPTLPIVLDQRKMVQQQPQARLLRCVKHGSGLRITATDRIRSSAIPKVR